MIDTDKKDTENEEERRLFFVALTRAKRRLVLTMPQSVDDRIRMVSSFIQELNIEPTIPDPVDLSESISATLRLGNIHIQKLNEDEERFFGEFITNYRLSATDLNKFLADPRGFLRDVLLKYPFEDTESAAFGRVYHKTLETFYGEYKKNTRPPDITFLTTTFSRLLSREILTPESSDRLLARGCT